MHWNAFDWESGAGFVVSNPFPERLRVLEGALFDIDVWSLMESAAFD